MTRFLCGGDEREVSVAPVPSGLRVTVDGSAFDVDLEPVAPSVFFLRRSEGGQAFHCAVAGSRIHLFWKGVAYVLERPCRPPRIGRERAGTQQLGVRAGGRSATGLTASLATTAVTGVRSSGASARSQSQQRRTQRSHDQIAPHGVRNPLP